MARGVQAGAGERCEDGAAETRCSGLSSSPIPCAPALPGGERGWRSWEGRSEAEPGKSGAGGSCSRLGLLLLSCSLFNWQQIGVLVYPSGRFGCSSRSSSNPAKKFSKAAVPMEVQGSAPIALSVGCVWCRAGAEQLSDKEWDNSRLFFSLSGEECEEKRKIGLE